VCVCVCGGTTYINTNLHYDREEQGILHFTGTASSRVGERMRMRIKLMKINFSPNS
jgi:hypothetical protein